MYEWQFQLAQNINADDSSLLEAIHQIFLDGFGLKKGWSVEGINKRLKTSNVIGFLRKDGKEICGYAFYSIPSELLGDAYMLWEDGVCLRKEIQGKGLTKQVVEKSSFVFPDKKFSWIGGRTQNPLVIKRYSKFGALFPFHATYAAGEGKLVMNYLNQHIAEVRDVKQLEKNTGICRGVYKEGRLGDYSMLVSDTDDYERRLLEWNFQRESGDAVIVVSKLIHPIQAPL